MIKLVLFFLTDFARGHKLGCVAEDREQGAFGWRESCISMEGRLISMEDSFTLNTELDFLK